MNTVNMLMNTLKMESPKKEVKSDKGINSKDFNELLEKVVDKSNKSTKEVKKEKVSENLDSDTSLISKPHDDGKIIEEEHEDLKQEIEGSKDYDKVLEMLSFLNALMKNSNQNPLNMQQSSSSNDFISVDLGNGGSVNSYLEMLNMVSNSEELSTLLTNLDEENKEFLLMLKLMTSSSVEDVEKYLKENLNMSQQEINEIMKFVESQKILEKLMKVLTGDNESLNENENSIAKDVFKVVENPIEGNQKLDSNFASLLDEEGEGVNTPSKEETLLKNIMNGSSGIKNFSIREIALNQSSNVSEQPVINKGNFAEDFIKSMKYMDVNNLKELTVKVMPKELGELVIKLTIESGVMKANLNATNKEAYELLSANFKDISDKLQNNNIKIGEVNINLYEDDTTFFSDDSRKGSFNQEKENKKPYKFQNEEEYTMEKESVDKNYLSYFV